MSDTTYYVLARRIMLDAAAETALLIDELKGIYPAEQVMDIAIKLLSYRPLFHVELALSLLANAAPTFQDYIRVRFADSSAMETVYLVLEYCMGYTPRISMEKFANSCSAGTLKTLRVLARFVRQLSEYMALQADVDFSTLFSLDKKPLSCQTNDKARRFNEYLALEIAGRRKLQRLQTEKRFRKPKKLQSAEKREEEHDAFLLSSGTLRRAESQLMKKYGNLDASAQTASVSAYGVADSQAAVEYAVDRVTK